MAAKPLPTVDQVVLTLEMLLSCLMHRDSPREIDHARSVLKFLRSKKVTALPLDTEKFCCCTLDWSWVSKEWECILTPCEPGPRQRGYGLTAELAYKKALAGKDKFR